MKIKPILFSTAMVQGIIEERKTQTRRIIKPQPLEINYGKIMCGGRELTLHGFKNHAKYEVGDILWVREGFRYVHHYGFQDKFIQYRDGSNNAHCIIPDQDQIIPDESGWKPSIFMPKAACRIFLEVTKVRVERLQNISEKDAIAEGIKEFDWLFECYLCPDNGHLGAHEICEDGFYENPRQSFKSLWQSINGLESWNANPWVWVYDFKRVEKPENFNLCP